MKRLSREEFDIRFPRRPAIERYDGLYETDLHIEKDSVVSGLIESGANLFIHSNAHVLITGLVDGRIQVDRGAAVWIEGSVNGLVSIDGAACLSGAEKVAAGTSAVVYDPTEPSNTECGED